MTTQTIHKIGKATAFISLICGILIFIIYYFKANYNSLFFGYTYVVTAIIINLLILFMVLYRAYKDKTCRKKLFRTAGLMVMNIPIAFLFFWLVMELQNTMRVTIINDTGQDITGVIIQGCEEKKVSTIKAGDSKHLWINLPNECGISMTYKQGGVAKQELVSSYLSKNMGGKATHRVGSNDITGI